MELIEQPGSMVIQNVSGEDQELNGVLITAGSSIDLLAESTPDALRAVDYETAMNMVSLPGLPVRVAITDGKFVIIANIPAERPYIQQVEVE